ncbi:hypothetical protein [Nitrososphaera sp.]|uniref:hypothetical protein n=1 Tax=Nitrososphaera sp. TaxID=1971748 RepID=UPI00307EE576
MESGGTHESRTVSSDSGRNFLLEATFFGNGTFLSVSEGGERRIGAVSVAISSQNNVNAARVIPSKHDPVFVSTLSEKVAAMTNGICIVSFYAKAQLALDDMKAIMGEVMNLVGAMKDRNVK